jgi:hypothetical protein
LYFLVAFVGIKSHIDLPPSAQQGSAMARCLSQFLLLIIW